MSYQDQVAKDRAEVDARASKNAMDCLQVIRRQGTGGIFNLKKIPQFPQQITTRKVH